MPLQTNRKDVYLHDCLGHSYLRLTFRLVVPPSTVPPLRDCPAQRACSVSPDRAITRDRESNEGDEERGYIPTSRPAFLSHTPRHILCSEAGRKGREEGRYRKRDGGKAGTPPSK